MNHPDILIVDYDADVREALGFALETEGYSVAFARSCDEAADRLLEVGIPLPRMILMELRMSGMSGWEFLEARSRNKRLCAVPVTVMSTSHKDLETMQLMDPVATGYLRKPLDLDELLDEVGRQCGNAEVA
jgi:CheY-like chemotaxis protein